jgi:(p)ppGpp synthase/HD superfamily hydrolase
MRTSATAEERAKPCASASSAASSCRSASDGQGGLPYEIKGRPKSVHSIYNKMLKKNVTFEEVYDVFAIRIIIDTAPNWKRPIAGRCTAS